MLTNEQQDELLDMNLESFKGFVEETLILNNMNQMLKDVGTEDFDWFVEELYDDGYSVSDAVDDICYEYVDRFVS
tara:strand:- start:5432 stop:5656 length:225 start_codon:yes stop_codon:yes gene_type:complete